MLRNKSEIRKLSMISRYVTAERKDPPGRSCETVIVQSSQDAQIAYQRMLPHAAAPIHTRFDMSAVLSAPRRAPHRCASHPEKRKRKYLRVLRLSIGFPACGTRFLLKALPTPKPNPICASIHPELSNNDVGSIFNIRGHLF